MSKIKKMDCYVNFVSDINNEEFILDCAKVGIDIEYIANHIHYIRNQ
jgi:succinyl-CoA synthetase beta subunit